MAVTRAGSVIVVGADNDTVAGPLNICGFLYKAGTGSPSVQVKSGSTSGVILWESASATDVYNQVDIRHDSLIHIDMAGTGTVLYIYCE